MFEFYIAFYNEGIQIEVVVCLLVKWWQGHCKQRGH
jgi:hypothetical protein